MKLTFIFLTVAFLNVSAKTVSQTVSLSFKNGDVREVFKTIKEQTGYSFLYEDEALLYSKPVNLTLENVQLKEALEEFFRTQPLTYKVFDNKTIVVKARPMKSKASFDLTSVLEEPPVQITGLVVDSSGRPLEGATVAIKGTKNVTTTDAFGKFSINANPGDQIVVSYVGFETKQVRVGSFTTITVVLIPVQDEMDNVVVISTGYQKLPLERATGSYTHISAQDLEKSNSFNLKDRIEGMVPGMFFETQYDEDQNPNSDRSKSIVIRGMGTFGNVNPLIVVDNAPFYTGAVDPWTLINPADVESITVLKDAAAASIWGAQAANGVIVITTKSGGVKRGQPMMNVSMDFLAQPVPKLSNIPWASSKDAIELYRWMMNKGHLDALLDPAQAAVYELPEVLQVLVGMKRGDISESVGNQRLTELSRIDVRDEFRELFFRKIENNKKLNITFQSGTDINRVRTSISAVQNNQYTKGNSDFQLIFNIVDEYTPKKWLKFSFGSNVFMSHKKENGVVVNELAFIPQMTRILDENGNYLPMIKNDAIDTYYDVPTQRRRDTAAKYKLPYDWDWNLKQDIDNQNKKVNTTNIRLYTNITVNLTKALTAELFYQYQRDHVLRSEYYNEHTWYVRNLVNSNARPNGSYPIPPGGMLYENQTNSRSHNARGVLTYRKSFGDHAVSVLGGAEIKSDYFDARPYGYYGYDPQSLVAITNLDFLNTITPKMTGDAAAFGQTNIPPAPTQRFGLTLRGAEDRWVSTYGNAGYTFMKRYDVTGSIRLDKANLFGQSASRSNLPQWSVGLGWQISDEKFFNFDWVDRMKLRFSYGRNGIANKGVSPYILGYPSVDAITQLPYAAVQSAPNPALTWEKTKIFNLGLDFFLLRGRLSGTVEVYHKTASDVLAQIAVNGTYGHQNNRAELNTGNISNKGVEISLNGRIIDKKNFRWQSRFNYGSNRNRAYNITQVNTSAIAYTTLSFYYHLPNQPVDFVAAAEWRGYDENGNIKFMYEGKEHTVLDFPNSSLVKYGELFKVVGQRNPKHFGQWMNNFSYKGIELNLSLMYKFGHKFVGDYPPTGLKNNYFTPTRFYTWIPNMLVNSWKSPADDNTASMYSIEDYFSGTAAERSSYQSLTDNIARYNTKNVMNAGSIRVQSIALAYTLPPKISGSFKSVRLQVEARNLGPIWVANEQGVDPDFPAYSSSVYGALQYVIRNRSQYSVGLRFGL